jgi:ribosome modulation factor
MDRLVANENKNKSDFRDELINCHNEGREYYRKFDSDFSINMCPYDGPRAQEWKSGWNEAWDNDFGE